MFEYSVYSNVAMLVGGTTIWNLAISAAVDIGTGDPLIAATTHRLKVVICISPKKMASYNFIHSSHFYIYSPG